MEDAFGFTLGLGIVLQIDRIYRQVTLHSPLPSLNGVDAIRLGDVTVDPETFEDRHLP
jgi:polynucleotide 5'-kinase involved in rRNA processing